VSECFDAMDTRITRLEDDMSFIKHYFDPPADLVIFLLFYFLRLYGYFFRLVFWLLLLSTFVMIVLDIYHSVLVCVWLF